MRPALAVLAVALLGCSVPATYGYREVEVQTWSSEPLSRLLARYVDSQGHVDYELWRATPEDVAGLDELLNLVANASPDSKPALFPRERDRLAYWMNAYNALVIRSIIEHWPLESVNDVKAGISFLKGKGFFANQRFRVGRAWLSLDEIEEKLRSIEDPRMHFAINCGSAGCPRLDATAFAGDDVDATLDRKARAFVNDEKNVCVDEASKTVTLSRIFDWYADDFGPPLEYAARYAEPPLRARLERARAKGFTIVFQTYDWGVNKRG